MFDNVGWFEILFVLVLGLIIIGPERLPGVMLDVKAAIIAARRAINQVKDELNGELGTDLNELKKPLSKLAEFQAMGPRRVITKTIFDDDDSFLDSLDINKQVANTHQAPPSTTSVAGVAGATASVRGTVTSTPQSSGATTPPAPEDSGDPYSDVI